MKRRSSRELTRAREWRYFPYLIATLAAAHFLLHSLTAQRPESEVRRILNVDTWSSEEIAVLASQEPVVRALQPTPKGEIATLGVCLIKNLPSISLRTFREAVNQKDGGAMKGGGKFGDPPTVGDLNELQLDDETIAELRQCRLRNCDLNLSSATIARIDAEIDWNSPDTTSNANKLFREMLVNYVRAYSQHGNTALGTYDNRRKSVDLAAEHISLLRKSSVVGELPPEFVSYLERYPAEPLPQVDNTMHWSVVDFGLKPTTTVSHVAVYSQATNGNESHFVASKQIYSSRYLDSSITFTILLRTAGEDGVDTYLIFLDRSRSDALEGPFGGFARRMVERESIDRVTQLLDRAHIRLLAQTAPKATTEAATTSPFVSWAIVAASVVVIASMVWLLVRRKRP